MIKLVVFDMAGTTIDEQNVVYQTVHRALLRGGHAVTLQEVLLHAAGKEKLQAIRDVLAHLNVLEEREADKIFLDFTQLLDAAYAVLTPQPMSGAVETFDALRHRGIKIALNTGYNRRIAGDLLARLGWVAGREYDYLVMADDVERGRPFPDMIVCAMALAGVTDPGEVAKIGDSSVDIEEGKQAGCRISAGVTTGAQTAEQMLTAGPTHIFESLPEILDLLDQA